MTDGKTIEVFLVDGDPNGLITAEVHSYDLKLTIFPRKELSRLKDREDAHNAGVYFLMGTDEDGENETVYIGESTSVYKRLINHRNDASKNFWANTIIATISNRDINTKYLESLLIQMALDAGRVNVYNGTAPNPPRISESKQSVMNHYIEQINLMLLVLGYIFLKPKPAQSATPSQAIPQSGFAVEFNYGDSIAKGIFQDGEILVLKGSTISSSVTASFGSKGELMRSSFLEKGVITVDPVTNEISFTEDHLFGSPSAAAKFIGGTSLSGWVYWRLEETGQTLAEWRDSQTEESE